MKSSYKIALVVAAVLVLFGIGYYLSQNGDAPQEPADGPTAVTPEDDAATRASRPAPTVPTAPSASSASTRNGTTAAPSPASRRPAGEQDTSAAPSNPLLAELRASLAAAQDQPGVEADVSPADAPATASPRTAPAEGAAASDAASTDDPDATAADSGTVRANDGLRIDPSASTAQQDTAASAPGAASTTDRLAAANTASPQASREPAAQAPGLTSGRTSVQPSGAAATPVGPEPDRPYFGPLPGADSAPAPATARPRPSATPAASTATTYTIKPGDTFSSIAVALYQDGRRWVDIAQANPLVDPEKLRVGQEIRLPGPNMARGGASRDAAEVAADRDGRRVTYVIRPGDTLSTIAQQFYGSAGHWNILFDANRQTLGNDPGRIRAGQEIVIPPAPRGAN